ncbi:MAG: hypothetical protein KGJ98_11180 [Chloroflexota bacterium]|nr:hypothetical protein [Chloroflexota bacterium]MDE3102786.1 hypothetical protein [Chloroflexota bacterium]
MTLDREVALATEHPRGTERKRLGPYREALVSPAAYAARPEGDRDAIVRWAEVRRLVKERSGIDHDDANLADPLVPAARLRAHVLEGERLAAGLASVDDPGDDLLALVRSIRARARA